MAEELNPKQKRFCEEFLLDLNATQAAIRAGYSKKTARQLGNQLLNNPLVQDYLLRLRNKRSLETGVEANRVLLEMASIGFSNMKNLFAADGNLLPLHELPDEVAAAISSVKVNEVKDGNGEVIGYVKEIKLWDKGKQIELMARHLGMLVDKIQHTGADNGPIQVDQQTLAAKIAGLLALSTSKLNANRPSQ